MVGAGRDGPAARRDGLAARLSEVRQKMSSKKKKGTWPWTRPLLMLALNAFISPL